MERRRARAGHGGRRDPLLRHQPPKGRVENQGLDKLAALARAMGFPPRAWFEEELSGEGRGVATGRPVERLFEVIKDPKTGAAYTTPRSLA
jgi:hypothetical protein